MTKILFISIIYALIRATHDKYLREGGWKLWAFIEGAFVALSVSYLVGGEWWYIGVGVLLFGFTFWIVFDMMTGIYFGGNPLYIGNTGFGKQIRKIFLYTERFKGLWYLITKLIFWWIFFYLYTML